VAESPVAGDHIYVDAPDAVMLTQDEPPDGVTTTDGSGLTETEALPVILWAHAVTVFVPTTVYVAAVV
jgi:hypothetical protein